MKWAFANSFMAAKKWFAADVVVHPDAAEAAESALNQLDALGTEIDSLRKKTGEPLRVSGYFNAMPIEIEVREQVNAALLIYGFDSNTLVSITTRAVEETDWLAEWKKHWKPTTVDKFIIAPPWETVDESEKLLIRIEPNMAFGTGTHETTQLCLKAIGELYHADQTFLDVGTGTGILAIAAAKLGGNSIVACDTDGDSIVIAKENSIANDVAENIEFRHGSIDEQTPEFDFVCANLTLDVIVPILPLLIDRSRGVLLLSGILTEQKDKIAAELRKFQISNFKFEIAGEWLSVTAFLSE